MASYNKIIDSCKLARDIFDKILYDFRTRVVEVEDIKKYKHGYEDKKIIYYDRKEYLICRENIIKAYTNHEYKSNTDYKLLMCRRDSENSFNKYSNDLCGSYAYNKFNRLLLNNGYTQDEICARWSMFEDDSTKEQWINQASISHNYVSKFTHCFAYDLNSAYGSMLCQIFPKAVNAIKYIYEHRHDNDNKYKNIMNYYVGMLKYQAPKTRNWIVNRIREKMESAYKSSKGVLIYVNTDGFILSRPRVLFDTSNNIGDFKIENDCYDQNVYLYQGNNYYAIQFENGNIKGSVRKDVRDKIDLINGKIVEYKQVGQEKKIIDIKEEIKDVKKII